MSAAETERLDEMEPSADFHEAIEQGLRSLETEPVVPLEEIREKIAQRAALSS